MWLLESLKNKPKQGAHCVVATLNHQNWPSCAGCAIATLLNSGTQWHGESKNTKNLPKHPKHGAQNCLAYLLDSKKSKPTL